MSSDNDRFASAGYKGSRKAYTLECAFEYFVTLLVSDSFLARFLTSMGFSSAQTGMLSSFISLAFLFQLLSIPLIGRISNIKKFAILCHIGSQLVFAFMYLIPFIPFSRMLKQLLTVVCLLLAYLGNYLVTSLIYQWGTGFVQPHKRGIFTANKEMISLLSGMVIALVIGYLTDYFYSVRQANISFLLVSATVFIFSLCDLVCLLKMKSDGLPQNCRQNESVFCIVSALFNNSGFRRMTLLTTIWYIAIYISIGFLGTYKINDLLFTISQVQLINILGCFTRVITSRAFGRYADRHTFSKAAELALIIGIASFAINALTTPALRWLNAVFTALYSICLAGFPANLINMTYDYVDERYFVYASALRNSIGGLFGFISSIAGSFILQKIQCNGNSLFGISLYGQQFLSILTVVFLIVALFLCRYNNR